MSGIFKIVVMTVVLFISTAVTNLRAQTLSIGTGVAAVATTPVLLLTKDSYQFLYNFSRIGDASIRVYYEHQVARSTYINLSVGVHPFAAMGFDGTYLDTAALPFGYTTKGGTIATTELPIALSVSYRLKKFRLLAGAGLSLTLNADGSYVNTDISNWDLRFNEMYNLIGKSVNSSNKTFTSLGIESPRIWKERLSISLIWYNYLQLYTNSFAFEGTVYAPRIAMDVYELHLRYNLNLTKRRRKM